MITQNNTHKASRTSEIDEMIMVIKRTDLFGADTAWHGLRHQNLDSHLNRIRTQHVFLPRSRMETDPTYKQIIPYLIFTHDNHYFLMQRRAQASEQRLRNKMSLGIGGHLRAEDCVPAAGAAANPSPSVHNMPVHETGACRANVYNTAESDLFAWARREFYEEVAYAGDVNVRLLGIINDDSNDVGKVHVGLVLILTGNSPHISIRSEHKSGMLVSLAECARVYDDLESWSRIAFEALQKE